LAQNFETALPANQWSHIDEYRHFKFKVLKWIIINTKSWMGLIV